jgi:hypothetical protein
MFRLLKLCVGLAAFVAFAWFGTTVKLGSRTLFQHLRAIGQTRESQDLVDGTKQAAEPIVDGVRRRIAAGAAPTSAPGPAPAAPTAGAPQERVTAADKEHLRRLIGSKQPH